MGEGQERSRGLCDYTLGSKVGDLGVAEGDNREETNHDKT